MKNTLLDKHLLLLLIVLLTTIGCGLLSPASDTGEAETTSGQEEMEVSLPFSDDFSDRNSGWPHSDEGDRATEYIDGAYRVYIDNGAAPFSLHRAVLEGDFEDVIIEVAARYEEGAGNVASGLICRYDGDRSYYFFDIRPDGNIRIGMFLDGDQEILADIEESTTVNAEQNKLRADCVGDSLAFYVNGELVATANDGNLSVGQVGLLGGGSSTASSTVHFDDFMLSAP